MIFAERRLIISQLVMRLCIVGAENMKAVIDRIDGDWIVFVDDKERTVEIPPNTVPV